jgi:hypothetical protein
LADEEEFAVLYSKLECSAVYAALGSPETGASCSDICERTGLDESVALGALELLIR